VLFVYYFGLYTMLKLWRF